MAQQRGTYEAEFHGRTAVRIFEQRKEPLESPAGPEDLVDSYLRVLAVACAIGRFNLTDRRGDNYLCEDCENMIQYFNEKSARPGAENLFLDLYAQTDTLVETEKEDSVLELLSNPTGWNKTATGTLRNCFAVWMMMNGSAIW